MRELEAGLHGLVVRRAVYVVAVIVLFHLVGQAQAYRLYNPNWIWCALKADTVLIVAEYQSDKPEIVLRCTEVLQGSGKYSDREIAVDEADSRDDPVADVTRLPVGTKNILVVLVASRNARNKMCVCAASTNPEDLDAARKLKKAYDAKSFGERLQTLASVAEGDGDYGHCARALREEFNLAKSPDAMPLLIRIMQDTKEPRVRIDLTRTLAKINDPALIPVLVQELNAGSADVRQAAAGYLAYYYPGAPGVDDAICDALYDNDAKYIAARYLGKREATPEVESVLEDDARRNEHKKETWSEQDWRQWRHQEVRRLTIRGDSEGLKLFHRSIVNDESAALRDRLESLCVVLEGAVAEERESFRQEFLPSIMSAVTTQKKYPDTYLFESCAKCLRAFSHRDCLNALLALLKEKDVYRPHDYQFITLLAIRELGDKAKEQVAAILYPSCEKEMKEPRPCLYCDKFVKAFALLIALDDNETLGKLRSLAEGHQGQEAGSELGSIMPWFDLHGAVDEEQALLALWQIAEKDPRHFTEGPLSWLVFRLGDLKSQRAVPLFLSHLSKEKDGLGSIEIQMEHVIKSSTASMAKPEMRLLIEGGDTSAERVWFEYLKRPAGQEFLPTLRQIVSDPDSPLRIDAARTLASVGTPEELPCLLPLCDYWKTGRELQGLAVDAVASIRGRFDFDVNGPIHKEDDETAKLK